MSLPEAVLINFNTFIVIMHNNSLPYCIPSVKSSGTRGAILFGGQRGMGNMVYWLGLFIQNSGTSAMFTHWQRPSLILRAEQSREDHAQHLKCRHKGIQDGIIEYSDLLPLCSDEVGKEDKSSHWHSSTRWTFPEPGTIVSGTRWV